jgi:hypothetical protein
MPVPAQRASSANRRERPLAAESTVASPLSRWRRTDGGARVGLKTSASKSSGCRAASPHRLASTQRAKRDQRQSAFRELAVDRTQNRARCMVLGIPREGRRRGQAGQADAVCIHPGHDGERPPDDGVAAGRAGVPAMHGCVQDVMAGGLGLDEDFVIVGRGYLVFDANPTSKRGAHGQRERRRERETRRVREARHGSLPRLQCLSF